MCECVCVFKEVHLSVSILRRIRLINNEMLLMFCFFLFQNIFSIYTATLFSLSLIYYKVHKINISFLTQLLRSSTALTIIMIITLIIKIFKITKKNNTAALKMPNAFVFYSICERVHVPIAPRNFCRNIHVIFHHSFRSYVPLITLLNGSPFDYTLSSVCRRSFLIYA